MNIAEIDLKTLPYVYVSDRSLRNTIMLATAKKTVLNFDRLRYTAKYIEPSVTLETVKLTLPIEEVITRTLSPTNDTARKLYLPYLVHRTKKGNWILLNREYKPLGLCVYSNHPKTHQWLKLPVISLLRSPTDYLDYDSFIPLPAPVSARPEHFVNQQIAQSGDSWLFFYNDSTRPTDSKYLANRYIERLLGFCKESNIGFFDLYLQVQL